MAGRGWGLSPEGTTGSYGFSNTFKKPVFKYHMGVFFFLFESACYSRKVMQSDPLLFSVSWEGLLKSQPSAHGALQSYLMAGCTRALPWGSMAPS